MVFVVTCFFFVDAAVLLLFLCGILIHSLIRNCGIFSSGIFKFTVFVLFQSGKENYTNSLYQADILLIQHLGLSVQPGHGSALTQPQPEGVSTILSPLVSPRP